MKELLCSRQLEPNGSSHQSQSDGLEPVEFGQHSWLGLLKIAARKDAELGVEAGGIGQPLIISRMSWSTASTIGMAIAGGTGTEVGLRIRCTPHQMLGRLLILLHLAAITRVVQVLVLMVVPFGSVVIVVVYNIVYEDAVRLLLALGLRIADLVIVAIRNAVAVQVVPMRLLRGYEELLADIRMRFQLFH